jgi:hypothetical protein
VKIKAKEIEIIHNLFLIIAMYSQASSSQFNESLTSHVAQYIKKSKCIVSHKQIELKTFFSDIEIQAKHLREVERIRQIFGNVLPVIISLKKSFWFNLFM